ncbi:hypothetical protein AVEN_69557-1 [Araneus ventricosus]|uniref:SEA domain-containing protein n=1 Tax=Araneus ventricosus TaxID=182803 RepID=A0A4Y2NPU5_ARAVE|nr:hypothetical protein AVEN_69557-1 [Araneus ventricosus]
MKTYVFYIILEFLSLHYHISPTFAQYPKDLFPDTELEKDDEIPNWEYEPFYEEFHKFTRSKQAELPSKSDTSFAEPVRNTAKKTADNGNSNALHEDRFPRNEAIPASEKLYPNDPSENNPPYRLNRNMKRPVSIENDDEGHLMKPNTKHNYYYYEETYPKHSHDRNNKFRKGIRKYKHTKSYDNYMQDRAQQHYVKEPLSYFVKKESMRPSKRLIHEIKVVEIANDMKDDGKPINIPKREVEESDDGNLEDESEHLSLKARNLEDNFSTLLSVSNTVDVNHIAPTKRTLSFPNEDKNIHARLIEIFQEPSYKSENDRTDRKRGISSGTLNNPAGKSKDLENLLNILTGGIGNEESLKPANEETEINIVMRRTVRQKDFKVGKNSSAYYGSVTHWKEDSDKQEKISQPNGNYSFDVANNFIPADSSDESQELRKKRNKSSRQLHSMYLVGPKGWKTFSKVSKRSHTESPRSLKLSTIGNLGNKTFDYEEDLSEKIKDFIHRHSSQNISDNESVDIDSNETKVIEVNEETLPKTNLTDINKKEKVLHIEQKTYHSLGKPESYKSPLTDVIETPAKKVVTSTVSKEPPDKNKNITIENLLTDLINEQTISPELQLLIDALNLHKGKSTSPSNNLTTESGITTHGEIIASSTVKPLQMNRTLNSLSTEATVPPKSGFEWDLSKIGNFLLQSIGLGTQTTQSSTSHEENGSSPNSLLKSNISSSKATQTLKTKNGSSLQKFQKPKRKKKIRTTKLPSTVPSSMTKQPSRFAYYGSKSQKKILLTAKKPPNTTPSVFWKHKTGRITTSIPKVSTICKYCSKEIKIIDTSVEISQTSSDMPVISNNTYKVFLENDVEWVTSPVKSVPLETESDEMEINTIAAKTFQLTTEGFFKKADIVFNKVFERNPQYLSTKHLEAPGKADIRSKSLLERESPSKLQQNEYSADGRESSIIDESNSELYKSPDKSVEYNKRFFELPKSNADNLASTRYPRQPKNVSENGKLTVNELISRNVILTDLLSLLNKKDILKKDLNGHNTSQNDRPKFFNLSGKHPYLAGFILGVGLVIIFLIFSIILYWMGFKKGQYDYYAKETEKEPGSAVRLLPKEERRATIADNGNVFYATNGDESTDTKTLKHLVAKASAVNAEDPVKEDVKLLKKRVISNENGVKPYKEIIPRQRSSSTILHHQSFRNNRKSQLESESFEPKLNSVSNDCSDDENWHGIFDKNKEPTLEILANESSVQKFKSPYRNKSSLRKSSFFK